jgi:hypothetical protein
MNDILVKFQIENPEFEKEIQMLRDVKFEELDPIEYRPFDSGWTGKENVTKQGEL